MSNYRLGTMGFGYSQWSEVFYPRQMKPSAYLEFYSRYFDAVELDTTFHATPPERTVKRWRTVTPADFKFCAKAPKQVTHDAAPDQQAKAMLEFVDVIRGLGKKLAVILLQFPPSFVSSETKRLEKLLARFPTDLRFAVEFRDSSWLNDRTTALLRERKVAWVAADYLATPTPVRVTADFLYLRWVGVHGRFRRMNTEEIDVTPRLEDWASQLRAAPKTVKSVYGFFNNDYAGYSIATCNRMKRALGLPVREPAPQERGELFE